jgi:sarcosine oxidase subunit alpha
VSLGVTIIVDGVPRRADANATLAASLLATGVSAFRRDLDGAPRAPLCGMGTCFECRVRVDDVDGVRACLEPVRDGMRVETGR